MEKGTYLFWDFESWTQRTRTDFKLEYAAVE
jgi:CCR4-NOT transcriptional regulation complex NOT5 subunit